ncbi:MAG: ATP-binding cassette domain-containing protein [Bdellovibrionales bacterium]|nr:ATP-binding cassette domain-containing protein [Bdellovibrionales bacterium]
MEQTSKVRVSSIRTSFGAQVVHSDVSFNIDLPQIVALIGSSGSGKSVLLKEIIGLLRPNAGAIHVLGVDIWQASSAQLAKLRSRIGVLFQNGALFSAINVFDNVAAPLREQSDLPEEMIEQLVQLRLLLGGLKPETAAKMPSELSGGMRKRVALARALALEPEILFLDEPTSGLDPINARAFDQLVRTLCDSLKITILLVTHDLDTLAGIVDRVIVLDQGKVIADGTVTHVAQLDHPWISEYFAARSSSGA